MSKNNNIMNNLNATMNKVKGTEDTQEIEKDSTNENVVKQYKPFVPVVDEDVKRERKVVNLKLDKDMFDNIEDLCTKYSKDKQKMIVEMLQYALDNLGE